MLPSSSTEAQYGLLLINLQSTKGKKCPSNLPLNALSKDKSVQYKLILYSKPVERIYPVLSKVGL
jgi:hypothetical protein